MNTPTLPHIHGSTQGLEACRRQLERTDQFDTTAEFFKTLADPTRVRLFWLLCHRQECVLNLAALLGISSPAVSHHIRPLKEAGLICSHREGKEVYYTAADTRLATLLHHTVEQLMEISCPAHGADSSSVEDTVYQVHEYLVENLSRRITIQNLCDRFFINPTTLKQAFKARYGMSIAAHMKKHRMEQAALLLERTDLPVGQIALAVGYESQSKFSAAFKETFQILPTQYQKQHNNP